MSTKWVVNCRISFLEGEWSFVSIAAVGNQMIQEYKQVYLGTKPVDRISEVPYLSEGVKNEILLRIAKGDLLGVKGKLYMRVNAPEKEVKYYLRICDKLEKRKYTRGE